MKYFDEEDKKFHELDEVLKHVKIARKDIATILRWGLKSAAVMTRRRINIIICNLQLLENSGKLVNL
jgi:hypothetical protein